MWLFVEPLDVVFFRENKPFAAGESHRAKTFFPPNPFPVVGAIRAKILMEHAVDFNQFKSWGPEGGPQNEQERIIWQQIGSPKHYGRLQMKGPFLARQKNGDLTAYVPAPFDLFQKGWVAPLAELAATWYKPPISGDPTDTPAMTLLWSKEELGEGVKGKFLDLSAFGNYLIGWPSPLRLTGSDELYQAELRVGIKLAGSRRTAETGMFYMSEFVRPLENPHGRSGLLLQLNLPDNLLQPGFLALGGEGRAALCSPCPEAEESFKAITDRNGSVYKQLLEKVTEKGRFKLYLASPAIFQKGWLPDFFRPSGGEYTLQLGSVRARLVAAAVGKPVSIGGWDLAEERPKPIRKAVPPGSVYFLEAIEPLDDDKVAELFERFHFTKAIQEESYFKSLAQVGFGLTFIGTWDPIETEGESHV